MPTIANKQVVSATIGFTYEKTVTGFKSLKITDTVPFRLVPGSSFNHAYVAQASLAASGTTTIDLYSFTTLAGESVTITKLIALMFQPYASVTGGQLTIEPGASNPLAWIMAGTTPSITLDVGTSPGACFLMANGTTVTVSSTSRNIKLSNPGSQTITVDIAAIVGT